MYVLSVFYGLPHCFPLVCTLYINSERERKKWNVRKRNVPEFLTFPGRAAISREMTQMSGNSVLLSVSGQNFEIDR